MTGSTAKTYVTGLGAGWYLPSIDELVLLYDNRFTANKALRAGGYTLISTYETYWSSNELLSTNAFVCLFFTGDSDTYAKSSTYYVRAVRAF